MRIGVRFFFLCCYVRVLNLNFVNLIYIYEPRKTMSILLSCCRCRCHRQIDVKSAKKSSQKEQNAISSSMPCQWRFYWAKITKKHTHTHMEWHTLSQGKRTLHTNRVFSLSVSRESGPEAINDNASRTGKKVQLLDLIAVMKNLFKNSFRLWVWVWNKRLQVARHNSGDGSDSSATKIERRGEGMKEEKTHHDTQLKKFLQKQLVIFVHLPWAIGKQCLAGLLAGYGMCYTSGYACW